MAVIRAIQNSMYHVKNTLGIPQSVNLFGLIKACPILVGCIALALVVLTAAFLG